MHWYFHVLITYIDKAFFFKRLYFWDISNYFGAFKVPHSVEFQKENILLNIQVKAWGAFQKSLKSDYRFLLEQGGGLSLI